MSTIKSVDITGSGIKVGDTVTFLGLVDNAGRIIESVRNLEVIEIRFIEGMRELCDYYRLNVAKPGYGFECAESHFTKQS